MYILCMSRSKVDEGQNPLSCIIVRNRHLGYGRPPGIYSHPVGRLHDNPELPQNHLFITREGIKPVPLHLVVLEGKHDPIRRQHNGRLGGRERCCQQLSLRCR